MTLIESVAKLETLIPSLKSSDANFASSLIAAFKKYGGLTPKQEPWIGKLILRAETPAFTVIASYPATPETVNVGGFAGVLNLFNTAKAHLKFPKVTLLVESTKVTLSLNGPKSKKPGFVSISGEGKYPYRAFYGSVSPEGVFTPSKTLPGLTELLTELSANPTRVAKDHGKLTGNCCFCNKVLGLGEDKRSVLVGFGPVCADHYGLKAEWLSGVAKAEAKASVAAPVLSVQDEVIESLTKGFEAPTVTLSASDWKEDGKPFTFAAELEPVNTDELQAELGPEYPSIPKLVTCILCGAASASTKVLHGHAVCLECANQLA